MKKIYSSAVKLVMLLSLVLCAGAAKADNVISIAPFTIDSYDVVNVPVLLDNTDAIAAFQFDVELPAALEFSGEPTRNSERLLSSHQLTFNPEINRVLVISRQRKDILGNSGAVVYLPIKVKDGMLTDGTVDITLSTIRLSSADGSNEWQLDPVTTKVTLKSESYSYSAYTEETEMVINPGMTKSVSVGINNNGPVLNLQLDVVLPQGITVDTESVVLSDRCSSGAWMDVYPQKDGVTTRFILSDIVTNQSIKPGADTGVVFTFDIKAADDYAVESGEMEITNFLVSAVVGDNAITAEGCKLSIVNGATAYTKANGEITALEEAMTAALATIAEEAPAVKDEFTGAEITAQIEALKAAVDAAYADGTLTGAYDTVMAPAADITTAITALVDAAKAAQAEKEEGDRKDANQAAYDAVVVEIDALQTKLDETLANVAEQYPDANVDAQKEAAQAAIDKMRDDAAAAFAAVAEEGTFDYKVDATDVDALIAAIEEAAKTSGIDGVFAGEAQGVSEVYTLDGLKVAAPRHGMNIIVTKAGEVKKVLVK